MITGHADFTRDALLRTREGRKRQSSKGYQGGSESKTLKDPQLSGTRKMSSTKIRKAGERKHLPVFLLTNSCFL